MLERLKEQVCEANVGLVREGLVALTWGNVSGIDRSTGMVVIKPSGVAYERMKPSDMVVVALESGEIVEGDLAPSSDTPTHRELYRSFASISGIAHSHSPFATAWAQARREIPVFGTTHADHFRGPIPVTRPMTKKEIGTDYELNTGLVIVERFKRLDYMMMPAVLVANHAPFAWGETVEKAVHNAVALEQVARMAIDTLQINSKTPPMSKDLLDKHFFRKHGPTAYYGQKSRKK